MYRTFYPSEEMVGTSDNDRDMNSSLSKEDPRNNIMTIGNQMHEAEIFLSASRSYFDTSKAVLENLKRYVCIAEADIHSASECITELEMRLQKIHLELQSLFGNIFNQDSGQSDRYISNQRKERSTQTTRWKSEHVLDTVKGYAKDKSIDLNNYTATCDEYDGATFVILHPNNVQPKNSLNLKRDSLGSKVPHSRKELEESASASGNVANRDCINSKESENIRERLEGAVFSNLQRKASCQSQPEVHTESLVRKRSHNSKPNQTSREAHHSENKDFSLPVKELRQCSFQKAACVACPSVTESFNEASFRYQHTQGKCSTPQHPRRKNPVSQTEEMRVRHSSNSDSLYPVKKSEVAEKVNRNPKLFVTQSEGDLTRASNSYDFTWSKDNEPVSGSASHAGSSRNIVSTQSRLATNISFPNPSKASSQFFETGAGKATFCNRRAVSLIDDFMEKRSIADKVGRNMCDRRNIVDASTHKRFSSDVTLEVTIELSDDNESNDSKNATLDAVADNIYETTAPSNSNTEFAAFTNISGPSCSDDNVFTSTKNTTRSFIIHGEPYSSSQKEAFDKRPLKFQKGIAEVKKSDSSNSMGNQTSTEENCCRSTQGSFCKSQRKEFNSKMQFLAGAAHSGNSSRKSSKTSEYFSYKELSGPEDNKDMMLLVDEFSDCSVSESITSENSSIDVALEYFDISNKLRESGSKCKRAADMDCVNISSETADSERFQNTSSVVCSHSPTATHHSHLSPSPRSSVDAFGRYCFDLFRSPGKRTGRLAENSSSASFTNTEWSRENMLEMPQECSCSCPSSSNPSSRTSLIPLVSSFTGSSPPARDSSSSVENSP